MVIFWTKKVLFDLYAGWHIRESKVHRSKGSALFIAYVYPSKNKLHRFMNKKYFFPSTYCFLSNSSLQYTNYLFWFLKNNIVHYLIILYIPCARVYKVNAQKWLLTLHVVRCGIKIIISILLPRFSPKPWYTLFGKVFFWGLFGRKKEGKRNPFLYL